MKLKLLALAGIMAATMGLAACGGNTEEAAEPEVQDAAEVVDEAATEAPAADMAAEMPAEGEAVDAADAAAAQ